MFLFKINMIYFCKRAEFSVRYWRHHERKDNPTVSLSFCLFAAPKDHLATLSDEWLQKQKKESSSLDRRLGNLPTERMNRSWLSFVVLIIAVCNTGFLFPLMLLFFGHTDWFSCLVLACKHSHSAALSQIKSVGIAISSSGGCSNRNQRTCTSLDQVNCNAIRCLKTLKTSSGCPLTVTGGTVSSIHRHGRRSVLKHIFFFFFRR